MSPRIDSRRRALAASAFLSLCCSGAPAQPWSHFAGSPARIAAVGAPPPGIDVPLWLAYHDASGQAIAFVGQSGVVADDDRVYAVGKSGGVDRVYAIGRTDGEVAWAAAVDAPYLGSWSTPAIDGANGAVVVASGLTVRAFSHASGDARWQAPLPRKVVNASPLVTAGLGPGGGADRVFITDYDPFGVDGRLHCINADPFDAGLNPFMPGQVVWSVVLGATSGNTAAYADGVVYVASVSDESGSLFGVVRAFDAAAIAPPPPVWVFENAIDTGFFGGVCVDDTPAGRFIYTASYGFFGGQFAGNFVKLRAEDGALVWTAPCNRTAATPIPLGDGRVVVSGGIPGFGSAPSLQLFEDLGTSAALAWDTAIDTWTDANANGVMDVGEYLLVGGWTHQPIAAGVGSAGGDESLIAGAMPTANWTAACTDLYVLDVDRDPADPGFVEAHAVGAGSTPAVAGASGGGMSLYTLGAGGLSAFGAPACYADCSGDGALSVADFGCFQTRYVLADPWADCTGEGSLTVADFGCFQTRYVIGCP